MALVGAACVALAMRQAPDARGAATVASPRTLLAMLDAATLLVVGWPTARRRRAASPGVPRVTWVPRALASLVVLCAALPFHAALAAASGASAGHAAASLALALAVAAAAAVAGDRPAYGSLLALGWCALPLAAYGLADLAGADVMRATLGSPLIAAVRNARVAGAVSVADALPALAVCALVAAPGALRMRAASAALVLVAMSATAMAESPRVVFDGLVRPGRPITVVVHDAERVRLPGAPWALPAGARGDEFVLSGGVPAGDTLAVEIDRGSGARETVALAVRPAPGEGRLMAVFTGDAGPGEVRVRAADLPTVAAAWGVFDGLVAPPREIPGSAGSALASAARSFDAGSSPAWPLLLPPSIEPFRAGAATAAAAPSLPADVGRLLLVLGGLLAVTALLVGRRGGRPWRPIVALVLPPLLVTAWLVSSGRLPGSVRVTVDVVDAPAGRLVLVRAVSERGGEIALRAPPGAGLVTALRWSADDAGPDADLGPGAAVLRLAPGRSAILAYALATDGTVSDASGQPGAASDRSGRDGYDAWLSRSLGPVEFVGDVAPGVLPEVAGSRAVPGRRFRVRGRP